MSVHKICRILQRLRFNKEYEQEGKAQQGWQNPKLGGKTCVSVKPVPVWSPLLPPPCPLLITIFILTIAFVPSFCSAPQVKTIPGFLIQQ